MSPAWHAKLFCNQSSFPCYTFQLSVTFSHRYERRLDAGFIPISDNHRVYSPPDLYGYSLERDNWLLNRVGRLTEVHPKTTLGVVKFLIQTNTSGEKVEHYLALINRAGGLYGRILTEVVSTDRTQ